MTMVSHTPLVVDRRTYHVSHTRINAEPALLSVLTASVNAKSA